MSKQAMWKQVLDNQEIKSKIEGTFKQIDEHVKDFQVPFSYLLECFETDPLLSSFIS